MSANVIQYNSSMLNLKVSADRDEWISGCLLRSGPGKEVTMPICKYAATVKESKQNTCQNGLHWTFESH